MIFWAKTDRATGEPVLSVRDHSFNVGAVALALIRRLPPAVRQLLPSDDDWLRLAALAALHDVGKISLGFARKCPPWMQRFFPVKPQRAAQHISQHDLISHLVLGDWFGHKRLEGHVIAAGGHHGRYHHNEHHIENAEAFGMAGAERKPGPWVEARERLRRQVESSFGPLPAWPLQLTSDQGRALTAFLTGLITLADWIGSDESFFPLPAGPFGDHAHLADCAAAAERAVEGLGWGRVTLAAHQGMSSLFAAPGATRFDSNTLQDAVWEAAAQPGLHLIEAPMGGGKTEAALAGAWRRWTDQDHPTPSGLYFALPTQLTSDRIFDDRLKPFLERALASESMLRLVHGGAWLREDRTLHVGPTAPAGDTEDATAARDWFASGRRALLAPFGVGTLDQALMSVLPVKHCGLRAFGLAGKVVVLDEVHSYDPYTSTLVDELVGRLLHLGASVFVLSATLTRARRDELVRAAWKAVAPASTALPATSDADEDEAVVTSVTVGAAVHRRPVAIAPKSRQDVLLRHYAADDLAVWGDVACAAARGACVLVIRNTVDSAQATWDRLNNCLTAVEAAPPLALLHSRFPRWRRTQLEKDWVDALGRGGRRPMQGCIVVATQVVEQSVDIDADLLVTDLAPTDAIFQRLGRLHRHSATTRQPEFDRPAAWLLHPALNVEMSAEATKKCLGAGGKVYPPLRLVQSFLTWRGRDDVHLPRDIRPLLRASYESDVAKLYEAAIVLEREQSQRTAEMVHRAKLNANCFRGKAATDEEGEAPTRWDEGVPTCDLLLLNREPIPLGGVNWEVHPLEGSPITVQAHEWDLAAARLLHDNAARVPLNWVRGWHAPRCLSEYARRRLAVGIVDGGGIICPVPEHASAAKHSLKWTRCKGIERTRENTHATPAGEPDDPLDASPY